MAKTVFITGITGYIGGSVAKLLSDKGYKIIGLVRNKDFIRPVEDLNFKAVLGDIQDEDLLRKICIEADIIIHTADSADDAFAADSPPALFALLLLHAANVTNEAAPNKPAIAFLFICFPPNWNDIRIT